MASNIHKIKELIRKYIRILISEGYKIDRVFLFGSFTTNKFTKDSDIDVAIISKEFTGNRFLDSQELMFLRRKVDLRIEPIPFRPKDFIDNDPLVIKIKKSGIRIR